MVLVQQLTTFGYGSLEACQTATVPSLAKPFEMNKDADPWTWQVTGMACAKTRHIDPLELCRARAFGRVWARGS